MVRGHEFKLRLPPDLVLKRAAEVLCAPSATADPRDALAERVYGGVHGTSFTMRRAPLPRMNLHGQLVVSVSGDASGSTAIVTRRGLDWLCLYVVLCVGFSVYALVEASAAPDALSRSVFGAASAVALAVSVYCVIVVVRDWKQLEGRLRQLFADAHAA